MRLFRSNKQSSLVSRALPLLDRHIKPMGSRFQRWTAPRLERFERQLSRRQKIILISTFCLLTGGYCTMLLVTTLSAPRSETAKGLLTAPISPPLSPSGNDSGIIDRVIPNHSDPDSSSSPTTLK